MSESNVENVEPTTLKFIRLSNNDELIAGVRKKKNGLELVNPMRVLIDAELDMSRQTIYMHSWIPQGIAKGDSCVISSKDVLFATDVEEDIAEYYNTIVLEMIEDKGKFKMIDKNKKKQVNTEKSKVISFPNSKNTIE
jgi:hypothetical protein